MREDGSFTRRARLLGIGLLAVAVLVGALAGAALERVRVTQDATAAEVDRDRDRSDDRKRGHILDEFDLTPEQQAEIDTILAERRQQAEEVWNEFGPTLRAISDSARSEIGAVLDAEQRAEYERFWEKRRERHKNTDEKENN